MGGFGQGVLWRRTMMTAGGIGEGGRERDISISRKVGRRSRWRWFPPLVPSCWEVKKEEEE